MVGIMFRVNYKDIKIMSTTSVFLVDSEQVNVFWDVMKGLLNDGWSIFKMLYIKFCPRASYFYWQNALMYNPFLNKNAGDTLTYHIIDSCAGNMIWRRLLLKPGSGPWTRTLKNLDP